MHLEGYLPGGQVYDLMGNAAEWSQTVQGGLQAVVGGDYTKTSMRFDLRSPRYQDPLKPSPEIGFRYIVIGSAP